MEWGSSRTDSHEYYRVSFPEFAELERLSCFGDGGTIDQSQFTALRVSASLPVTNYPFIDNDLVRIYAVVTDEAGNTHREALATLIPTYPAQDITAQGDTGTITLYSVLYLASVRKTLAPYVIPAGTPAISHAAYLLTQCGVPVIADASAAALAVDKVYDPLTTYLDIVNDLCDFAGFGAVTVDGMGNALLKQYVNPNTQAPAVVMTSGDGCVFAPVVSHELDTFSIPNRYTVVSSPAEGASLSVTAINDDPGSIVSTVSRGYYVDAGETVSDIADATALAALALRRLADATSAVESIEISHVWLPFDLGDVVLVDYEHAGERWQFTACTRSITLGRGTMCKTRLRRFVTCQID